MPEFLQQPPGRTAAAGIPGGELVAGALKAGGVDTIFTVPGGHIMPLLDACPAAGIRVIGCRHEGAAALAAEGWALATGRTGVATVTAGPGFTNSVTGLIDAGTGHVPAVLIGGRTPLGQAGRGSVMDIDQRAIAAPAVKWSTICPDPSRISRFVTEALYRSRAGRPGAVYLEIPMDVMSAQGAPPDATEGFPAQAPRPAAPAGDIELAVRMLEEAERPVIIAGGGAFWSGAGDDLRAFCERSGVPVTTTSFARGLIADSHPLCLGFLLHGGLAVVSADVVLVLGSAFNANLGYGRPPILSAEQKVIQVDLEPAEVGGNRRPDLAIAGDVSLTLRELAALWRRPAERYTGWMEECGRFNALSVESWDRQVDGHEGEKIHPGAVAREVVSFARDVAGPTVTLVADGGDAVTWGLAYSYAEGPGRFLATTTALGTLGVGVPFGLAAAAARPGEPVLVFTGDGAFGLSAMEIETAARESLPLVAVVANNAAWGDVKHEGAGYSPDRVATDLGNCRYDLLAQALGGHGEHVTALDRLRPALERSLASGTAAVVNVETDPTVLSDLMRMVGSMSLM
ncbi:MAG TPA: thiamine pyrophosphate-binding protein [Candidatus Dormibacteraeota bacterium]